MSSILRPGFGNQTYGVFGLATLLGDVQEQFGSIYNPFIRSLFVGGTY